MPRWAWVAGPVLAAIGAAAPAAAQPLPPADPPPAPRRAAAPLDHPPAILGAPVAVVGYPVRSAPEPAPAPAADPPPAARPVRAALGAPSVTGQESTGQVVPAGAAEAVRTARADRPADPVNDFLARRTGAPGEAAEPAAHPRERKPAPRSTSGKFGDRILDVFGERGEWFRSDHAFDGFISPVTNPFLFEDPRSLTEIRPIYLYQRIPGRQPDTQGGNVNFFGVQGRVAVTERLSFTINKLGGVWYSPASDAVLPGNSGFSELWLGPKFTFIRGEESGSLLAGGLQFQIPVGSGGVFQDTGSLSLVPYATYGQKLFRDAQFGGLNTLVSAAYAFGTDSARSDYLSLSGHVSWDVMNWQRLYPLLELNYVLVTTDGGARPQIGVEGRDLFNLGGAAKGHGLLTGAAGARFKITESAQVGAAFEIPLAGPRDLFQYRFTVDFILRY